MICQSSRKWKRTCSQHNRVLDPFKKSISWKRTCLLSSLENKNSGFLRKEFHKDSRPFLEDFLSTVLSTVAARSPVGQGLRCFCPEVIIWGVDYSAFHLFEQLLDGLFERGWVRGPEIEPAKVEFYLFVREEWHVEVSGSRSRVQINSVFAFCNQPGFRSRWNLYKISVMVLQNHFGLLKILHVCCFEVFLLTALVVRGPSELHPIFTMSLDGFAINLEKVNGAVACVQDFVRHSLFTQRNFSSETGTSKLSAAVAAADAVRHCS